MRWCFQNAAHPYADGILQQLAIGAAFVPVMWLYEVSAVLVKSQKDGILTGLRVDDFLITLNRLNITVLELALRKSLPLATSTIS